MRFFPIKFPLLILRAFCRNNKRIHVVLHCLSCTVHYVYPASHPILSLNQHSFELPGELLKAPFDSTVPLYSPAVQSSFGTVQYTLQQKSRLCTSRKEIARPLSQFLHSCVCERFIYSHDIWLQTDTGII